MEMMERAFEAIRAQQGKERGPVWMVGEQLKDILRDNPGFAPLVVQDMENKNMLSECERKIKADADKHKTGNFSCVTPAEAEEIIRGHFGLHGGAAPKGGEVIDLSHDSRFSSLDREEKPRVALEDYF